LRQQIAWKLWKSRQTAPLWNAKQFTRDMEAAYEGMWEQSVGPLNWEQIAIAQVEQKKLEAATISYQKALAIAPDAAPLHYALGVVQQQRGNWEVAIDSYQQAVQLDPSDRKAWTNLGALFQEMGQPQPAIDCYQKILSFDPEDAIAHMNLSIVLRQLGNWERGFAEFEWRWRCPDKAPRDFPQPLWDGSDLEGKTILIHAEDGYGDTLQFIRFLPQVAQRGGRAIVECPPWLVRLLGCVPGIAELIPFGSPLPEFAVHAPLLSLVRLLGATPETLPAPPYLSAPDSAAVKLPTDPDRLKVGIVWAGNPNHQRDHDRSTTLEQFRPLLAVEGVDFYSLQKGPRSPELEQFSQRSQIQDLSADLHDFGDTAAAIEQLDLVISVDTSVAHLAGALGKPVWVLLSHNADWRWMLDRDDTPWYPTMRLFRQSQRGDWAGVFASVVQELQAIVASRPRV
jgi:tetratricopeptide (TPR) repeat protein